VSRSKTPTRPPRSQDSRQLRDGGLAPGTWESTVTHTAASNEQSGKRQLKRATFAELDAIAEIRLLGKLAGHGQKCRTRSRPTARRGTDASGDFPSDDTAAAANVEDALTGGDPEQVEIGLARVDFVLRFWRGARAARRARAPFAASAPAVSRQRLCRPYSLTSGSRGNAPSRTSHGPCSESRSCAGQQRIVKRAHRKAERSGPLHCEVRLRFATSTMQVRLVMCTGRPHRRRPARITDPYPEAGRWTRSTLARLLAALKDHRPRAADHDRDKRDMSRGSIVSSIGFLLGYVDRAADACADGLCTSPSELASCLSRIAI